MSMLAPIFNGQIAGVREALVSKYTKLTDEQRSEVSKAFSKPFPLVEKNEAELVAKFPDYVWMNEYHGNKGFIIDPKSPSGSLFWRLMPDYLDQPSYENGKFTTTPNPQKPLFMEHLKQTIVFSLLLIEVKPHTKSKEKDKQDKWVKGSGGPTVTPYGKAVRVLGEMLGVSYEFKYKADGKTIKKEDCVKKPSPAQLEAMEKGRRSTARKGVKKGKTSKVKELEKVIEGQRKQLEEALLLIQKTMWYMNPDTDSYSTAEEVTSNLLFYCEQYGIPLSEREACELESDTESEVSCDMNGEECEKKVLRSDSTDISEVTGSGFDVACGTCADNLENELNEELNPQGKCVAILHNEDEPDVMVEEDLEDCEPIQTELPVRPDEPRDMFEHGGTVWGTETETTFADFVVDYTDKKHYTYNASADCKVVDWEPCYNKGEKAGTLHPHKFSNRIIRGYYADNTHGGNWNDTSEATIHDKMIYSQKLYEELNEIITEAGHVDRAFPNHKIMKVQYRKCLEGAGLWKDTAKTDFDNKVWEE